MDATNSHNSRTNKAPKAMLLRKMVERCMEFLFTLVPGVQYTAFWVMFKKTPVLFRILRSVAGDRLEQV